jgi:hypothetical protein
MFGSFAATVIRIPQEEIKVACQSLQSPHALSALLSLYLSRGFFGLYRNAPIVIVRDVLWHTISYTLFQWLRSSSTRSDNLSQRRELLLGAVAGLVACVLTHPLDVMRTVLMVRGPTPLYLLHSSPQTSPERLSIGSLLSELRSQKGALSSGLLYRIAYLAPMSAISYTAYDLLLRSFARRASATKARLERDKSPLV